MIVIYLGDIGEYLGNIARAKDPQARLITKDDCSGPLVSGTYYTSLGDLGGIRELGMLLQQADRIIYAPPANDRWSGGTNMRRWTETYLETFGLRCTVENYDLPSKDSQRMLRLSDTRKTSQAQLWVAGCSISHGIGVETDQRYGCLLSKKLDLPVSFLTCPGSSVIWAADQLLRSDIRTGDIVIWGLTSLARLPYFAKDRVHHINVGWYIKNPDSEKYIDLDELASENSVYRALTSIWQVRNYCSKIKADLVMPVVLNSDLVPYLRNVPGVIMLANLWGHERHELFLDMGNDEERHPGPSTHQFYADEILEYLQR